MKCKALTEGKEPGWQDQCDNEATRGPYCEQHYRMISRSLLADLKRFGELYDEVQRNHRHFLKETK